MDQRQKNPGEDPAESAGLYRRMAHLAYDLADACDDRRLIGAYLEVAAACLRLAEAGEPACAEVGDRA